MATAPLSLADFRVRFPEFENVPDPMISAALSDAVEEINFDIWKELTSQGHGLLTAHNLSNSPWGQGVKLVAKDGSTTYGARYAELRRIVACGVARLL